MQLRRAREGLSSPSAPGEHASRQDLADLVNAWIMQEHHREAGLTANYIGKLERGLVRWPNCDYRAALRIILGVEHDADLGFHRPRRTQQATTVTDVDRKGFIRTALGVAAAVPLAQLAIPSQSANVPSVVAAADIGELRNIASVFSTWDHTYGGGPGPRRGRRPGALFRGTARTRPLPARAPRRAVRRGGLARPRGRVHGLRRLRPRRRPQDVPARADVR
ncbi:hypothetical protein GCM10020219_043080 [Nonomuraea dietziae]